MSNSDKRIGLHPLPSAAAGVVVQVRPRPSIHAFIPAQPRTITTAMAPSPVTFDCPPTILTLDSLCGVRSDTWRLHLLTDPANLMGYTPGFGNVYNDGLICWGTRNPLPRSFVQAYGTFWAAPFNQDLTRGRRPGERGEIETRAIADFDRDLPRHRAEVEAEVGRLFPRYNPNLPTLDSSPVVRSGTPMLAEWSRHLAQVAQALRVPWYAPLFMTADCVTDRIAQVVAAFGACTAPDGTTVTSERVTQVVDEWKACRTSATPSFAAPVSAALEELRSTLVRYANDRAASNGTLESMSPYRRRRVATLAANVIEKAQALTLPEGWTLAPWLLDLQAIAESMLSAPLFQANVNTLIGNRRSVAVAAAIARLNVPREKSAVVRYYEGEWATTGTEPVVPKSLATFVLGLAHYALPPTARLLFVGYDPALPAEYVLPTGNTVIGTAEPQPDGTHAVTLYTTDGKPGMVVTLAADGSLSWPNKPSVVKAATGLEAYKVHTPSNGAHPWRSPAHARNATVPDGSVVLIGAEQDSADGYIPEPFTRLFAGGNGVIVSENCMAPYSGIARVQNGVLGPVEGSATTRAELRNALLAVMRERRALVLSP